MDTIIDRSKLEELRAGLRGIAYTPGEEGYEEASRAWNLNAHQSPAVVVVAEGAADVLAAVRLARKESLGVGVMATGHGVAAPCDGGGGLNKHFAHEWRSRRSPYPDCPGRGRS